MVSIRSLPIAMGKSPCCDEVGIKKGPWTPEEDIALASYIQQHGPRNWKLVPINTGMMRCSKSCRLRWTNYLRPGIKRGNFTPNEDGMIIRLQSLLGNRWAAIASYLPGRTDNDIKNYWNTHLKKRRIQNHETTVNSYVCNSSDWTIRLNLELEQRFFKASTYASSTDNISRLLKTWRTSPAAQTNGLKQEQVENINFSDGTNDGGSDTAQTQQQQIESLLSFEDNRREIERNQAPLSLLEDWLLEEGAGEMEWQQQYGYKNLI